MSLFNLFGKKEEVKQPVVEQPIQSVDTTTSNQTTLSFDSNPFQEAPQPVNTPTIENSVPTPPSFDQIFSGAPIEPVQQVVEQPVVETPIVPIAPTASAAPVIEEQQVVEQPVAETPSAPVTPVVENDIKDDNLNFEPSMEQPEYETGAVVEEPQPIVEQQIALEVNPDEVFEGGETPIQENIPVIENATIEQPLTSQDLQTSEEPQLVTPTPVVETNIEPVTIPEVNIPVIEQTPVINQPQVVNPIPEQSNIPIGVSAPIVEQPVVTPVVEQPIPVATITPIQTPEVTISNQIIEQPVPLAATTSTEIPAPQPVAEVIEQSTVVTPVAELPIVETPVVPVTPVSESPVAQPVPIQPVRKTKFCDNCGEMITNSTLTKCPNCGMDL